MLLVNLSIVVCLLVVSTSAAATDDLEVIGRLFPGLYDNIEQYLSDVTHGVNTEDLHVRITAACSQQQVGIFPQGKPIYIEEYTGGNESEVIRQRLYYFTARDNDLLMKIFAFREPSKFLHAKPNASVFWSLQPADLQYQDGCDVAWARQQINPTVFQSSMNNTCQAVIPGSGQVTIKVMNVLTDQLLTVWETYTDSSGKIISRVPSPHVLLRQP